MQQRFSIPLRYHTVLRKRRLLLVNFHGGKLQDLKSKAGFHQSQYHAVALTSILLPPVVFSGLLFALWTWKCFMMVMFQNKIIYMPGIPPNARRETISDYSRQCLGIKWQEERTQAIDGTEIVMAVASIGDDQEQANVRCSAPTYILYFQGTKHHYLIYK
jgi:hypothetical protein